MSRFASLKKATLLVLGTAVAAAALAPTSASAFGHFGGGRMGGGGSVHLASVGRGPTHGSGFNGGGRGPHVAIGPRLPHVPGHGPRGPRFYGPHYAHYRHFYPGPIVPVGAGVAVYAAAPIVTGRSIVASGTKCAIDDGAFLSVMFLPTITAADINTFMKTYNVTMADGPNQDGIYRLRLSDRRLSAGEIDEIVASMRSQKAIVQSVTA